MRRVRFFSSGGLVCAAAALAATVLAGSGPGVTLASPTVFSFGAIPSGLTYIATPIDATNLSGKSISQIAGGVSHSLLLADDGTVFSFGNNGSGQLGLGSTEFAAVAVPIDATNLAGKKITQVAAGRDHSLLLAEDGTVFSFGSNAFGLTGQGASNGNTLVATAINTDNLSGKTITQIACGELHSLLLAEDGTVFSFGANDDGRTGLGTDSGNTVVATPIEISNLAGKMIIQVATGGYHSLLLADDGSVFSFGEGNSGQTGLGLGSGDALIATQIDTANLTDMTVTQIGANAGHSLLLTDDGTVFSFGSNVHGELGRSGGSNGIATPIDTTNLAGKKIVRVSAGGVFPEIGHSLLLAEDGTAFSFGASAFGQTGLGTDAEAHVATPIDTTNLAGLRVTSISAGGVHSLLLAVPEPGGATLLLLGGLAFLTPRKLRRQSV